MSDDAPKAVTPAPRYPPGPALRRSVPAKPRHVGDHAGFQRTVGRAALGAGVGAVVADLVTTFTDTGLWESPLLTLFVVMGALTAIAQQSKHRVKWLLGAGAGVVGALAFTFASPLWPPFAALLLGLAAAPILADGQPLRRMAVTGGLAGLAGAAGLFVARVMLGWEVFEGVVPSLLGHAAAGATAGMFLGLASAPKHLGRPLDPVAARYQPALAIKDGEIHEILGRAFGLHRTLQAELQRDPERPEIEGLQARERELLLQILDIADTCRQIERDLAMTPTAEIEGRIRELSSRAEATADQGARETYRETVASLEEQLESVTRIQNGRERIVARLHATVALLEKLRFALIHQRSADAERVGGALTPVTDALDALTLQIEATSSAVGEVFGGAELEERAGPRRIEGRVSAAG